MLISLLMYFLGVPLWMLLGMLILVLWNRKRVKNQPGSFPVKVRLEVDPDSDEKSKWPRSAGYAQWVHDVLIVRKGPGMMLSTPYGIRNVAEPPQDADPDEVKGLGDQPMVIRAQQDDGSILQIAVSELHSQLAPEHFQTGRDQEQK